MTERKADEECPLVLKQRAELPERRRSSGMRAWRHVRKVLACGTVVGAVGQAPGCWMGSVDPAPPAQTLLCADEPTTTEMMGAWVWANALWEQRGTDLVLHVDTRLTASDPTGPVSFVGTPELTGATLVEHRVIPNSVSLVLLPDAAATSVRVTLPLSCAGLTDAVQFDIDVSGLHATGLHVTVRPAD
jgi:hypothetical protein